MLIISKPNPDNLAHPSSRFTKAENRQKTLDAPMNYWYRFHAKQRTHWHRSVSHRDLNLYAAAQCGTAGGESRRTIFTYPTNLPSLPAWATRLPPRWGVSYTTTAKVKGEVELCTCRAGSSSRIERRPAAAGSERPRLSAVCILFAVGKYIRSPDGVKSRFCGTSATVYGRKWTRCWLSGVKW